MTSKKVLAGAVVCILAMGSLTPLASARVSSGQGPYYLDGANYHGYKSVENGNIGYGKFYKFDRLHYILGVCTGKVTNDSGRPQVYRNCGYYAIDPEYGSLYLASHDLQRISGHRGYQRAQTRLIVAYKE